MASQDFTDNYNSGIDPSEMDYFFDFSQSDFQPGPSSSPSSSKAAVSRPSPHVPTIDPMSTMMSPDNDEKPQFFSAPSHDYRRFKQQTPLPTGSIARVTAVQSTFDSPAKYSMNSADINFAAPMGFNSGIDMDFETTTPHAQALPAYFYPNDASLSDEYVDPSSIASEEPPSNVGRLWPGMHSQQAEQAKAEADAKRQQQQHLMQQRARQMGAANPAPQNQVKPRSRSQATSDPAVEERISRLLDQMRQNSATAIDAEASSPSDGGLPHVLRQRKDEEDMDEDERLLASEEGKKLSSKERRQLRNKVSARAFRSRRKEYISQLEGEVNAKSDECEELKMQVRRLTDQNAQLTSLTQTLLRHDAFQTVLTDMSNDPSIIAPAQPQQSAPKDVNPYQAGPMHGETLQVGMTMMPEPHIDFTNLNLGSNWTNTGRSTNFSQPQVFALYDIPEEPILDTLRADVLSGKAKTNGSLSAAKATAPQLNIPVSSPTTAVQPESNVDVSDIANDPSFALYVNATTVSTPSSEIVSPAAPKFESSLTGKVPHFTLVVTPSPAESSSHLVDQLLASAEATLEALEALVR